MAFNCVRGGSDEKLRKKYSLEEQSGIGITCLGRWWSHRFWNRRDVWMWHLKMCFRCECGGVGLTVGQDDLEGSSTLDDSVKHTLFSFKLDTEFNCK